MITDSSFDIIVAGLGSMGAPTCYYLARRGYKVLGIEQFDISHELGSHTGQSRIIRKAYFEHSDYVPLLTRAYENWSELEKETGEQVYFKTGLAYFGLPTAAMVSGTKRSADLYNIPLEAIDDNIRQQHYPQFSIPAGFEGVFEPDAGFLTPEKAIRLYAMQAIQNGATIHTKEKLVNWKKDGNSVVVSTDKNTYHCNKLILTAGAWSPKLFPGFSNTLNVTRQFIAWIKPKKWEDFLLGNFPCWLIADSQVPGCYYGFPVLPTESFGEPYGLKTAHHYPGDITNPDHVNRQTTKKDIENIMYAMDKYFPGVFESIIAEKTCLYTNTPDEDFIIDKLPGFEDHVSIACGFSGHGFKFASVVGEILADLATEGRTNLPIEFLRAGRFHI